jgi:hypothetical protein
MDHHTFIKILKAPPPLPPLLHSSPSLAIFTEPLVPLICLKQVIWVQVQFLTKCFPEFGILPELDSKILWLLGVKNDAIIPFITAAILTFQYCIWENKLKKTVPSFHTTYTEFLSLFTATCKHNTDIRASGSEINYELCRYIFGIHRRDPDGEE